MITRTHRSEFRAKGPTLLQVKDCGKRDLYYVHHYRDINIVIVFWCHKGKDLKLLHVASLGGGVVVARCAEPSPSALVRKLEMQQQQQLGS